MCYIYVYVQIDKYKEKKRKLQAKVTEITSLLATDLWLRDLDALEAEWNRILRSSASNVDDGENENDDKNKNVNENEN